MRRVNYISILSLLGKYVLSSGKDSLVKLWEMSTTRCLIAYTGAGATGKQVMIVYSGNLPFCYDSKRIWVIQ